MCIRDSLRPTFTQHELVLKLAHHFHSDIRLAIYSQGIKTIEELSVLLAQLEHIVHNDSNCNWHGLRERNVNFVQREKNCCEERETTCSNIIDPPNAGKGGEVKERETKLSRIFNTTDSLNAGKYGERGKQSETIMCNTGCLLTIMTRADSYGEGNR